MTRRLWRSGFTNRLEALTALNALSTAVGRGFDEVSAVQIARTVSQVLDAEAVAVSNTERLIAQTGTSVTWGSTFDDRTRTVLERRRLNRPTLYHFEADRQTIEVAVAVLTANDEPIGTVHVVMPAGTSCDLAELHQLTSLISSQLQLAELEQSRVYAAEAELRALRAQVSPHFLHNALTAIAALILSLIHISEPTRPY